jgi:hypothetical protein
MNDCLVFEGFETLNDEPVKPHEISLSKSVCVITKPRGTSASVLQLNSDIFNDGIIFPIIEMACLAKMALLSLSKESMTQRQI